MKNKQEYSEGDQAALDFFVKHFLGYNWFSPPLDVEAEEVKYNGYIEQAKRAFDSVMRRYDADPNFPLSDLEMTKQETLDYREGMRWLRLGHEHLANGVGEKLFRDMRQRDKHIQMAKRTFHSILNGFAQ